jgi:hypothetical protein
MSAEHPVTLPIYPLDSNGSDDIDVYFAEYTGRRSLLDTGDILLRLGEAEWLAVGDGGGCELPTVDNFGRAFDGFNIGVSEDMMPVGCKP